MLSGERIAERVQTRKSVCYFRIMETSAIVAGIGKLCFGDDFSD
jgi:hypothetical protein